MGHPIILKNDKRRYLGKSLYHVENIKSTNQYMLEKIGDPFISGDVLAATSQSKGLGRHQRSWLSPAGGLYASILFEEIPPVSSFYPLILLLSLSITEILEKNALINKFSIKWPNDIFFQDKKICGILTQSRTLGEKTDAVIGFGINLNAPFTHQDGLRNPAISLKEITGKNLIIMEILDDILNHFDEMYRQWVLGRFDYYLPILNQKLYGKGKAQTRELNGKSHKIIPIEFTRQGYLRADINGTLQDLQTGELS